MLEISKNAITRINYLLRKENRKFFRISVIGGGCSGFKYDLDFADEKSDEDLLISIDEINILVDDVSLPFLKDSTLDYEETLSSAEFKIINPQASAKCGCGNSFAI